MTITAFGPPNFVPHYMTKTIRECIERYDIFHILDLDKPFYHFRVVRKQSEVNETDHDRYEQCCSGQCVNATDHWRHPRRLWALRLAQAAVRCWELIGGTQEDYGPLRLAQATVRCWELIGGTQVRIPVALTEISISISVFSTPRIQCKIQKSITFFTEQIASACCVL